jgi:acetyl esterase/lipase
VERPVDKKYPPQLLDAIKEKQRTVQERGLDILIKPIPDDDRPGAMDPRLLAITEPIVKGFRGFLVHLMSPMIVHDRNPKRVAKFMRRFFNTVQSIPISQGVSVEHEIVQGGDISVPIRIYRREAAKLGAKAGAKLGAKSALPPLFLYIHGGGFAAGLPEIVEEMVKRVTELSGCVAVQPDYRLAPEHPYPAALEDCWAVLKWIHENASSLGGDRNRIFIAGDSAGGNLATVCAMRNRNEGSRMVRGQILLYPVVNLTGREDENYHFSLDQYQILREHKKSILFRIHGMRSGSEGVLGCLLGVKDEGIPYISPYLWDLSGMPPCLIMYGEFDCLRLDSEAYARKLLQSGVPVRAIRYLGMGHAFAEYVGVQPQADDCMLEISRFLEER